MEKKAAIAVEGETSAKRARPGVEGEASAKRAREDCKIDTHQGTTAEILVPKSSALTAAITKKQRTFSAAERVAMIQKVQNGAKQASIAREYNCTPAAVSLIMKDKERILSQAKGKSDGELRKTLRVRDSHYPLVDALLYEWYQLARRCKVQGLSKRILQAKADAIAKKLVADFDSSAPQEEKKEGKKM